MRVARYATNIYHNTRSMTDSLENLNWETLETIRIRSQLTMMLKIMHGLVDMLAEDYLIPASTRTKALHTKKLRQYTLKYSFFPRTITTWNSFSASIVSFQSEVSNTNIHSKYSYGSNCKEILNWIEPGAAIIRFCLDGIKGQKCSLKSFQFYFFPITDV